MKGFFKKENADKGCACRPNPGPNGIGCAQRQNQRCPVQEVHADAHTNKKTKQPHGIGSATAFFCLCQAGGKTDLKKTGYD